MSVHLNDLSKVYLNNIIESTHTNDDEDHGEDQEHKYTKKSGKKSKDYDGDGEVEDETDEYAGVKDRAIKNAKKKVTTESFSNWRDDLIEIIEPERLPSKMKEGKVDNYSGKNKCITINPEVKEQVQILESFELSEEYITETVNGAVDYFMEEGINEDGLEIIIDELGIEEFVSFVFEIGNEVLTEARTLLGKKKNPQKLPKGTAPTQATKAAVAKYGTTRKFKSSSASGVVKKNRPAAKAVEKAKETQTSKKPVRDAIARGVFGVVKAYQAGMERHKAAMNLAKETGKTVAKAAKVGAKGASEFGKGVKSGATATVDAAKKAKKVISAGYEVNGEILDEKATSEQQQKLFGLALSVKRGQTPRSEASAEVLKIVDSMSEKKIRDFAKTKHEGIPKKVEEALTQVQQSDQNIQQKQKQQQQQKPQQKQQPQNTSAINAVLTAKRNADAAQQRLAAAQKAAAQKKVNLTALSSSYQPEGDLVDEQVPTRLFYKLQAKGKGGSKTARAQMQISSDLENQKNEKMRRQQTKQRQEREPEEDHPSLSARERNPNLR